MPLLGRKRRASAVLGDSLPQRGGHNDRDSNDDHNHASTTTTTFCSFCQQAVAAVAVRTSEPIQRNTRTTTTVTRPYCLLHYYTTPAARVPTKNVVLIDPTAYDAQYPATQKLFAEAFVQLQQELSEATARLQNSNSSKNNNNKNDPLAILHHIHKKARKPKKAPPPVPQPRTAALASNNEGGFLRHHDATPARIVKTQQAQARKQAALLQRMERAATAQQHESTPLNVNSYTRPKNDVSKRRKSSRKSIWNVVMDNANKNEESTTTTTTTRGDKTNTTTTTTTTAASILAASEMHPTATCAACGSGRVRILASHTARDGVRKGEIWGGARDETSSRVQCTECGKMWNEEE